MASLFDYNALRDDHPRDRWLRFGYFLLDLSLLVLGLYFLYRYWSSWQGHSSMLWWWLIPAILGLVFGGLGFLGIWRRGSVSISYPERYIRLDEQKLTWWLDLNETPQEVALADIKDVLYEFRDVTLNMKDGSQQVLHTYLITLAGRDEAFREVLKGVLATSD